MNQLESDVSSTKFHSIFGKELSVALESTLDHFSDKELEFNNELYGGNQDLIYRKLECWRTYYPAALVGDITTDQEATISFLPWFSGPEVQYNRLVLRMRPITGKIFRWMMLGRFGEEKSFSFAKENPFINLDFFSKRNDKFLPLFVKIKTNAGEFIYFSISGEWGTDAVTLKIARTDESQVPPCLIAAKP